MVLIFGHHHIQYSSLSVQDLDAYRTNFSLQPPVATSPPPGELTLTARLQPSDGSTPGLTISLDVPTTIPTARARPCGGVQSRLQLRHGHHHLPINALLLATKLQMLGWTAEVYEGGPASQPASPTQPNPTRGHGESKPHVHDGLSQEPPRVRKEMGEEEIEGQKKKREKQRDANRPPPQPIVVHLSPPTLILVKPGPQSAMASSRLSGLSMFPKTLPAPLQTATPAIGLVRLQTTIPRLLSSQPAPCLPPPARYGTAGKGR